MRSIIEKLKNGLSSSYSHGEIAALSRIIATELLGLKESTYFLKEEVALTTKQQAALDKAIESLTKQMPIQYILGYEFFCGLKFKVTGDVLIPRPETQELVAWIVQESKGNEKILDIGTGSGCIAISLAHKMPDSDIHAWDISLKALEIAKENSQANNTQIDFAWHDILSDTPCDEKFDIIVSNPPYIKESEKKQMCKNVLDWEPSTALFVPDNAPLLFYRTIAEKAHKMLSPQGAIFFEINREHGKEICNMLAQMGYTEIELRKDFAQNDRMIKARKKQGCTIY